MAQGAESWSRSEILYQAYPRSCQDTDDDGVGDLRGVIERLDHLAWLGVGALWLNPITASPDREWGYDVSDYTAVHPELGTLADVDALLEAAHARGLRVLLDLVPNHTSDQHRWFREARSSRESPLRDYYVWADPAADGGPPNNWLSFFGGPAWTLDETTGQYYLHNFLACQPDLNWWSEAVRDEFDAILRFWFDRGVDGFRIDVAHAIVKDRDLRDNPPATSSDAEFEQRMGQAQRYSMNRPEVHDVLRRWRALADAYEPERVLLGEAYVLDYDRLAAFYGERDELHLAFNFLLTHARLDAAEMREVLMGSAPLDRVDAWPAFAGSNHDIGRMASRWAGGDPRAIRAALMLLLTLRGTPCLYYGDELGLTEVAIPPERRLDPGTGPDGRSRDAGRTPMPWTAAPNGGFTPDAVTPWLPLGDTSTLNVESQRSDPGSPLFLTRDLVALRAREPDLGPGAMRVREGGGDVLAWERGERHVVAVNLSAVPARVELGLGEVRIGTDRRRDGTAVAAQLELAPWEGVVARRAG
jgi:alpha-glucosidase